MEKQNLKVVQTCLISQMVLSFFNGKALCLLSIDVLVLMMFLFTYFINCGSLKFE